MWGADLQSLVSGAKCNSFAWGFEGPRSGFNLSSYSRRVRMGDRGRMRIDRMIRGDRRGVGLV